MKYSCGSMATTVLRITLLGDAVQARPRPYADGSRCFL